MHQEVKDFLRGVKEKLPNYFKNQKVYEIGSRNINGTVRDYFTDCDYTGFDLSEGNGVDVVLDWGQKVDLPQCDVIVCCEVLEHCQNWKCMLVNILETLKPNGLMIITAAGYGRPEHGTTRTTPEDSPDTTDYYKNILLKEFIRYIDEQDMSVLELSYLGTDARLWGIKRNS